VKGRTEGREDENVEKVSDCNHFSEAYYCPSVDGKRGRFMRWNGSIKKGALGTSREDLKQLGKR